MTRKYYTMIYILILGLSALNAQRTGSDKASPYISNTLDQLFLKSNATHLLDDQSVSILIESAAQQRINVFELIDCVYRWAYPKGIRLQIEGSSLRKLESRYELGDNRVHALLPVEKLERLETGSVRATGEKALDIYLSSDHETFIEIGTALYDKRFGFEHIEPLLFAKPYGIAVKKMVFTSKLDKLALYEPGKGAIYVKGFPVPKKWVLNVITKKK